MHGRKYEEQWYRFMFSDESRICLWAHDGRRAERRFLEFADERETDLTKGVIIWKQRRWQNSFKMSPRTSECPKIHLRSSEAVPIPFIQGLYVRFQQDIVRPHKFSRCTTPPSSQYPYSPTTNHIQSKIMLYKMDEWKILVVKT